MKTISHHNSIYSLLNNPIIVLIMIIAISIGTHMLYFYLVKEAYQGPVYGPYHRPAKYLLDSKGTALFVDTASHRYSLAYLPPIYTFFLAASYLIFGETWFGIAVSLSIICGLVGFVSYLLGRKIFSNAEGILAGLWVIFYPYYFFQGSPPNIYETMLFTLLLLASVWFLLQMQENPTGKNVIPAAFFLGLTALCRPKIVFLIPFILVWYYLTSNIPKKIWVRQSFALSIVFLVLLAPWTIRNLLTKGILTPFGSYGSSNLYKAYHPMMLEYYQGTGPFTDISLKSKSSDRVYEQGPLWDEQQTQGMSLEQARAWDKSMPWSYWINHPGQFVKLTAFKVISLWSWRLEPVTLSRIKQFIYFFSYVPILILGLVGFWLFRDKFSQTSLFITLFISFTFYAAITYGVTRYRAPLDVYLIILASAASIYIIQKILQKIFRNKQSPANAA